MEPSLTPGEYGGNMDCVETRQGTVLYLPVFVRGALLGFGDIHAAQGDGEITGVALETTAEVTLRLGLRLGPSHESGCFALPASLSWKASALSDRSFIVKGDARW